MDAEVKRLLGHEPDIVINGQRLSMGEAMTVRVAIAHFHEYVCDNQPGLGKIADGYAACCATVEKKMGV